MTRRNAQIGDLVRSGDAGRSDPLFTIVGTEQMRVVVRVSPFLAPSVNPGDLATIRIGGPDKDRVYEGKVAHTAYELDTSSHMLSVEIDLADNDGGLRPGEVGHVEIQLEPPVDAITIPSDAVLDSDHEGTAACYLVRDGRAVRTPIAIGRDDDALNDHGDKTEVTGGLKEGDIVITRSDSWLTDGQPVTVSANGDRE